VRLNRRPFRDDDDASAASVQSRNPLQSTSVPSKCWPMTVRPDASKVVMTVQRRCRARFWRCGPSPAREIRNVRPNENIIKADKAMTAQRQDVHPGRREGDQATRASDQRPCEITRMPMRPTSRAFRNPATAMRRDRRKRQRKIVPQSVDAGEHLLRGEHVANSSLDAAVASA